TEMSQACRKDDPLDVSGNETMPHYWARTNFRTPEDHSVGFAYSFLGVRLQCAQCHKHPFDQWTQDDFQQFSRFFGRVAYGVAPDARVQFKARRDAQVKDKKELQQAIAAGAPFAWNEIFLATPNSGDGKKGGKDKKDAK